MVCPVTSWMSLAHLAWFSTGSTLRPMTLAPRLANSRSSPATAPSSVVQTGVKSFGWEKRTAQLSPIHSWKWIVPCVVSAVKSGATSLIRSDIFDLPSVSYAHFVFELRSPGESAERKKPTRLMRLGWVCAARRCLLRFAHPRTRAGLQQQQRRVEVVLGIIVMANLLYRLPAELA